MTSEHLRQRPPLDARADAVVPPYSRGLRIFAGVSLLLAGILNGLSQYISSLLSGDLDFTDYIRWGADNPGIVSAEQTALVVSMLFAPLGLLGLAHVTRWRAPRLTAMGTALVIWGMWGFHNILAMGYLMVVTAPDVLGAEQAVRLSDGLGADAGALVVTVLPHLVGSFFGLILLSIAGWRSRAFPRTPLVLLVAFLVWDFLLPSVGPLEPHFLLFAAWAWLGMHLIWMSDATWRGEPSPS